MEDGGNGKSPPCRNVNDEVPSIVVVSIGVPEERRRSSQEKEAVNDCVGNMLSPTVPRETKRHMLIGGEGSEASVEVQKVVEVLTCAFTEGLSGGAQHNDNTKKGIFGGIFEVGSTSKMGRCKKDGSPNKSKTKRGGKRRNKKSNSGCLDQAVVKAKLKSNNDDGDGIHTSVTPANSSMSQNHGRVEGVLRRPMGPADPPSNSLMNEALALSENSVGDSGIPMGNGRFVTRLERMVAEQMWVYAKEKLGVTCNGDDEMYIDKVEAMEARDQSAVGNKGKPAMSK